MNLSRLLSLLLIVGTLDYSPVLAQEQSQSPVFTIPARRAQGLSGSIVQVKVYPGFGHTIINFRPTGERVRQVTLGDSSKVALNSDDPGCLVHKIENESEERRCNATVLYLRQINLPPKVQAAMLASGLPTAPKTRLTVLTDNDYPYIFEIIYALGSPEYSVVTIKPEVPQSPRPRTLPTLTVPAINRPEILSKGYQVALERQTVPLELDTRIRNFLSLVRSGTPVEQAAQLAGISMQVVSKLAELGQSNFNFRQVTHPQPLSIPWVRQPLPVAPN